jgi:hypothetical protein
MPWRSFSDRQNVVWTHFRDVPVGVSQFFSKEEIRGVHQASVRIWHDCIIISLESS